MSHTGDHCLACKDNLPLLLTAACGKIEGQKKLPVRTYVDEYSAGAYGPELKSIYKALQRHRHFDKLVKAKNLRPVDYFAVDANFIIEIDEVQHFTEPRVIALEMYPNDLALGFDKDRWLQLAKQLNRKMNKKSYPHRDEQRAWLDTLRDFAPVFLGLGPTRRLYERDRTWCELNPEDPEVISDIRQLLNL